AGRGKALPVRRRQVRNEDDPRLVNEIAAANAESANLDHAGQFGYGPNQQFSTLCVEADAVVSDQNRGWNLPRAARQDKIEGEARLAGAGWTANQHRAIAHFHSGRMHAGLAGVGHSAGSLTVKRAPATVSVPSVPTRP